MKSEPNIKERPILFSAPMVRAILAGRKSVTRRIVKPQPEKKDGGGHWWSCSQVRMMVDIEGFLAADDKTVAGCFCPYGQSGDHLWVREAFLPCRGMGDVHPVKIETASYVCFRDGSQKFKAGGYYQEHKDPKECKWPSDAKWRPSIHMPRWASRITLEVVSVRVERVQDITEQDAEREGAALCEHFAEAKRGHPLQPHKTAFAWLWTEINGRDSWSANPWVWVVEFKQVPEVLSHG